MSSSSTTTSAATSTTTSQPLSTDEALFSVTDPSVAGAFLWLGIASLAFFVSILTFECIRKRKWGKIIFYTRHMAKIPDAMDVPRGIFSWIRVTIKTPESYLIENAGLDAVMFVRFQWMCFVICVALCVAVIPTIVPVNYFTGEDKPPLQGYFSNSTNSIILIGAITMDKFSISNVPNGSPVLYFHVISAYVVCYWVFLVLYTYYKDYAALAGAYLRDYSGVLASKTPIWRRGELVQLRTIMASNIPEGLRDDTRLKEWFEGLGIGEVETVVVDRTATEKVLEISRKREKNLFKVEKAYIEWVNNIETEIRKRGVKLPKSTAAERESELGTGESRATASAKHVTAVLADAFDDNLGDFEDGHVTAQHLESPTRITRYEDETVLERSYIDLLDEATLKSLRPRLGIKSKHNLKKQQKKQLQAAGNDKLAAADDHIELGGIIPDRRQSMAVSPTADAIDHYTEKLQILTANLKQQRLLATNVSMSDKPLFGATAFITFKTQRSAMIAAQTMLHSATSLFTMQIRMAPSPRDIIWQDIHKVRKYLQSTLMQVLTFIICFFMTIPTSQLTSLITAQTLGKMLGLTDRFKTGTQSLADSFVLFVWETLGPPIVVSLVNMGIIPYILHFMSLYQGFDTHSQVERSTMSKYFFFLFFNVFFVFTLIWPLWTLFQNILHNPVEVIMLVAQTLPTGATFFINYIILCMLAYPVELLRIFPIAYTFIHKRFITTPRQYHDLNFYTSYLNYGILYPLHVLLFVVVICYSIIAPLIIIPGSIYFGLGWLIFKNQLMFVYVKEFESYGRHWIMAFDRCVVGCVVFQLTLAGILASKNCEIQALAVLPLLPITYYYWRYCHLSFRLKTELVPLDQLPPPSFYARRAELEAQEAAQVAAEEERRNKGKKAVVAGSSVVNKASDLGDVVGSAEEHLLERYPTSYLHPVFSKPLPRPWIPRVLAKWYASGKATLPLHQTAIDGLRVGGGNVIVKTTAADMSSPFTNSPQQQQQQQHVNLLDVDDSPVRHTNPFEFGGNGGGGFAASAAATGTSNSAAIVPSTHANHEEEDEDHHFHSNNPFATKDYL